MVVQREQRQIFEHKRHGPAQGVDQNAISHPLKLLRRFIDSSLQIANYPRHPVEATKVQDDHRVVPGCSFRAMVQTRLDFFDALVTYSDATSTRHEVANSCRSRTARVLQTH